MKIHELFHSDVTRDLPPVVYFHEQSPEKLRSEVGEYIITGGHAADDPRGRRVEGGGIHEQFVHLLRQIDTELQKPGGVELPSSWISGFYGSGKSSFAKLLGLSLDGATLPDGSLLSAALLARDDSARAGEFAEAWRTLRARIEPIAAVFDIGAVARDHEHIHAAALRQVQARLGYCSKSNLVAEYELKLQRDGHWGAFLEAAVKALGRPWEVAKREERADDHFSVVLHELEPRTYTDPMSWIDSRSGSQTGEGTSADEVVGAIGAMLDFREKSTKKRETLFLVIDEVSQYIHQDSSRALKLQSFVSALGQMLKGRVWLFATSQQKLEDASEADNIGKLKGRFVPGLRVHLSPSNIRDVVHRRLLKKARDKEQVLTDLFQQHRVDLKLHGYQCEELSVEDFVEVYPLLPAHIDLLMRITSSLHTRKSRAQGDDHAIRGLLQLLGELFRQQKLADEEVGALVTLDAIYAVQGSALEADVQTTLSRLFQDPQLKGDALAPRAAKAVALLELVSEKTPTTAELVAQCLYSRLGQGSQIEAITRALERLRALGHLSYSEKQGYKIQSSAGQEWNKEREDFSASLDEVSKIVRQHLRKHVEAAGQPRFKDRPFFWGAFYSDDRGVSDDRVVDARNDPAVSVDFRFLRSRAERGAAEWIPRSDAQPLQDRIVWVSGDVDNAERVARELYRSRKMVERYEPRRDSLSDEKKRLLVQERATLDDLESKSAAAVAEVFLDGTLYFRGLATRPADRGSSFGAVLTTNAQEVLPKLYPHFTAVAVREDDLKPLFELSIVGPPKSFFDDGLGILSMDAGKPVATCRGVQPTRILEFIEASALEGGDGSRKTPVEGATIITRFGKPPNGYPVDVVRACLLGLLRAGKIQIKSEGDPVISSVRDPDVRDLFRGDRRLRRAVFSLPGGGGDIGPRDRVSICNFFRSAFGVEVERDNDPIADAVYQHFPPCRDRVRELEALHERLPGRPAFPELMARFGKALDDCRRSRQVRETVVAVRDNLEALRDGHAEFVKLRTELTAERVEAVQAAASACDVEFAQLRAFDAFAEVDADAALLARHLAAPRPWDGIVPLRPAVDRILAHYQETRQALLNTQSLAAEASRRKVKLRPGMERLTPEKMHHVLRPLTEALIDTRADATSPSLVTLRERFLLSLPAAEQDANERLDEELNRGPDTKIKVVRVQARLAGQEVATREELKALLAELEARIGQALDAGSRVRIV
jgi:hypothetical protein